MYHFEICNSFCVQDENEEDGSGLEEDTPGRKRRKIRKILKDKKLSKRTVDAAKAEEDRRKRIDERQKLVSYDFCIYHLSVIYNMHLWY